jgi:glycosyltransferase involved in cell wall biosynthesis
MRAFLENQSVFRDYQSGLRISVIIPARNEASNLPHVLAALPAGLHEVIVVDGHSTDGTIEVARRMRPDARIVQQTRCGKGNALACGFAALTGDVGRVRRSR